MPDKPLWCGRLEEIAAEVARLPFPWVDRELVEQLLGVGRRRAQQILAGCVSRQIGRNGLAEKTAFLEHLHRLARGEAARSEAKRRHKLALQLDRLRRDWVERPRLLVEAPRAVLRQGLAHLPDGVTVAPGEIRVRFEIPAEALEKLLALAMAIGNDLEGFEGRAMAKD
jgi:hypothetical protein